MAPLLQSATAAVFGCQSPGAHMCSVITVAGAFGNPITGDVDGSGAGVTITNGDCESIVVSGKVEPQSPGFYGDFHTTYGTELLYWADSIGHANVRNINFHYLATDQWYYQSGCSKRTLGFDPAYTVVQCNFPC
ncbi:hypothetical protein BJX68DRAFT_273062 [Aspergillus pseudodeflectus]|uniref:Uncharacterized protein n=1 Tax=Aspergillus pseudodeflectus TaxID=176178 RepID=A0ABR4JBK5_9EURO